jgi:hypothetical protein
MALAPWESMLMPLFFERRENGPFRTYGQQKPILTNRGEINMTDGLQIVDGQAIYYRDGKPCHAGAVRIKGSVYYISADGKAVRGQHVVHGTMGNGILKRGTYTFGEDYKLVKGSYIPPAKQKTLLNKEIRKLLVLICVGVVALAGLVFVVTQLFADATLAPLDPLKSGIRRLVEIFTRS